MGFDGKVSSDSEVSEVVTSTAASTVVVFVTPTAVSTVVRMVVARNFRAIVTSVCNSCGKMLVFGSRKLDVPYLTWPEGSLKFFSRRHQSPLLSDLSRQSWRSHSTHLTGGRSTAGAAR